MLYYKDLNYNYYALKHEGQDLIAISEEEFKQRIEFPRSTEEQIEKAKKQRQINALKLQLAETDYKAIKHLEGQISDDDYLATKEARQALRDEIKALEAQL